MKTKCFKLNDIQFSVERSPLRMFLSVSFCLLFFLVWQGRAQSYIEPQASTRAPETKVAGWSGRELPTEADKQDLKQVGQGVDSLEQFVAAHPDSGWTPAVRNELAANYRANGRITKALEHWGKVWQQLKDSKEPGASEAANHALSGQLELLTKLGRVETLPSLLQAAASRTILNHNDRRLIEMAREGYVIMASNPGLNYRCGTLALAEIARMQGQPAATIAALVEEPSPKAGISLLRLVQLSRQYHLGLVAVKRTDDTPLPVPCVVHWAQNHYGALLEYNAQARLYRAVFDQPNWISTANVDAEASGYFLVPASQVPVSWKMVSDAECSQALGRSFVYSINDSLDKGCKKIPTQPGSKCPTCPVKGMPNWWVSEPYINLWLADEPWDYTTSRGEEIGPYITLKQRDSLTTDYAYPQPGIFHNWYSKIYIQNSSGSETFANWTATVDMTDHSQVSFSATSLSDPETLTQLQPTYGVITDGTVYHVPGYPIYFPPTNLPVFESGMQIITNLPTTPWNDAATGYRLFFPDGSVNRYGLMYWHTNTTSGHTEAEALLTQHSDPMGNNINLFYQTYTNPGSPAVYFRLTQMVDYDNLTNTFSYFTGRPGLLQAITSPYGQVASFAYDSNGYLTNITDAVTNSSGLTWNGLGRITQLSTPYGNTLFNYYDAQITNDETLNGDLPMANPVNRAVTVSDPANGTNIYVYKFNNQFFLTNQFSTTNVPQNTPLGTLDVGTNVADDHFVAVSFRNSFHWGPRQCAALTTLNVTNMMASDYRLATMSHWLGDTNNALQTDLISVEQDPSPDGVTPGQLTFYDYFGKTSSYLQGTNSQVAVVAHRQPTGDTDYKFYTYNSSGYVTREVSTYGPLGGAPLFRTNVYVYGTNTIQYNIACSGAARSPVNTIGSYFGFEFTTGDTLTLTNILGPYQPTNPPIYDLGAFRQLGTVNTSLVVYASLLLAVTNADGSSIHYGYSQKTDSTVSYYPAAGSWSLAVTKSYTIPSPVAVTNEVNYITRRVFDASNRLVSITSPAGLVTTNLYNAAGFLATTIDLQIGRTNSYLAYNYGLPTVQKNELGLLTTNGYDPLQRLVYSGNAAGAIANVYSKLDLVAHQDRLGQWSYFQYDALRNLIAVTNANTEVTLASYCQCGALNWLRDPLGNFTYFNYDFAGRRTNTSYADGYSVTNYYNALGEETSETDGTTTRTNYYNLQGLLVAAVNGVGSLGANTYDVRDRLLATEDARGVVTSYYRDAAGQILTNLVAGISTNTYAYAGSGLVRMTDGLGNPTYYGNDAAGRTLFKTNANLETIQYQYDPENNLTNLVDGASKNTYFRYDQFNRLTNKINNASSSVLNLTYDANDRIVTRWTPEKGFATNYYDKVGRILTNVFASGSFNVYCYDANGRLTNMVDGIGVTAYTYTLAGQLASEVGPWPNDQVAYTFKNRLRNSLTLSQPSGLSWQATYLYDTAARLTNVTSGAGQFGYQYHPGFNGTFSSPLWQNISLPNSGSITQSYDSLARITSTKLLKSNLSVLDSESYNYNANNYRTQQVFTAGNYINYAYDNIGQLKAANGYEFGGVTNRLNEEFWYSYDKSGNLFQRTNNLFYETFNTDNLNQLTNINWSGNLTLSGSKVTGMDIFSAWYLTIQYSYPFLTFTVNNTPNSVYYYSDLTFATSNSYTLAVGANNFPLVYSNSVGVTWTNMVIYSPVANGYQYDQNGNLTNDGMRAFGYDAENELTNVTVAGNWRVDFLYDGLGRRRITRDYTWTGSSWSAPTEMRAIYDHNLLIQELDANNHVLVTYTRGLDLSGGIGGLLARTDYSSGTPVSAFYHVDANGNIMGLVNGSQVMVAQYLYSPFGQIEGKWGPLADVNEMQFSSMPHHNNSGLSLFPYRAYEPNLQRWLNRDPIEERGGINLYEYVANNPLNRIDPMGLQLADPNSANAFSPAGPSGLSDGQALGFMMSAVAAEALAATGAGLAVDAGGASALAALGLGGAEAAQTPQGQAELNEADAAMASAMQKIQALGKAGEKAACIKKNTERIRSLNGTAAYRVPDVLDKAAQIIGDVKNVQSLSMTPQLQDFLSYAQQQGYQFQLTVDANTYLSSSIINNPAITVIRMSLR